MRGGTKCDCRKLIAPCFQKCLRARHAEAARSDSRARSIPLAHQEPRRVEPRSQREHGGMLAARAGAAAVALGGGCVALSAARGGRSEEHTSELQSLRHLVC